MKMKVDLSKFKLKHKDEKTATLVHPDGHEVKIAIHALHPHNRKNLEGLKPHEAPISKSGQMNSGAASQSMPMADGGKVAKSEDPTQKHLLPGDKLPNQVEKGDVDREAKEMKMASGGKLEVEKLEKPVPKHPVEYEKIEEPKPKNPVDAEPIEQPKKMAEGGEAKPEDSPPVVINNNAAPTPSLADTSNQLSQMPGGAQSPQPTPGLATQSPQQPQAAAPTPEQPATPDPSLQAGYQQKVQGVQEETAAQKKIAEDSAAALKGQAEQTQKMMDEYQTHYNQLDKERQDFQHDLINEHIDPQRFLGKMDSKDRMMTSVALILGGLGAGATGGPNQALNVLNRQIEQDIDAQKSQLGKRETLLSANMRQFGNVKDATEMTKLMMGDMIKTRLEQIQAKNSNPLAAARAKQMLGDLQMQQAPMFQQLATRKMLQSSNGEMQQDPASFVPQVVPKEHQTEVFKEIERAQNTRKVGDEIVKSFDAATHELEGVGRAKAVFKEPRELNKLAQLLGTTVTDLTGSARQAEFDNVHKNLLPNKYDTAHDKQLKKEALITYLQAKQSAPVAKGYGIDLSKFSTTKSPEAAAEVKTMGGVKYQKVAGGWKKVQ